MEIQVVVTSCNIKNKDASKLLASFNKLLKDNNIFPSDYDEYESKGYPHLRIKLLVTISEHENVKIYDRLKIGTDLITKFFSENHFKTAIRGTASTNDDNRFAMIRIIDGIYKSRSKLHETYK